MDDLNPITRTERLLDGEDLTPTNREEMFIKRIYDKTQEIPEPVNRKEYFLKKAGEAGGDITVESLSVTQNGTYTAPSGKAYTPVTVEVQPPANSYQLKSMTTPTSLATFEASEMPMPSLKVSVEAKQDLHGYDKPWVGGAGTNKWDEEWEIGRINITTGENAYGNGIRSKNFIIINPSTEYRALRGSYSDASSIIIFYYDASSNYISYESKYGSSAVFTTPSNAAYIRFNIQTSEAVTYNHDIAINYPASVTTYSPYSNECHISGWDNAIVTDTDDLDNPTVTQTTTISLGQTVYGGELDVVNGELKITDGYIASYNGETLPSTWISSMDVYAEGTTPTTGAEVCYELAEPIIINLTPSLIKSLNGTNNLSVDCGEIIELEYFKEV